MTRLTRILFLFFTFVSASALAESKFIRWTGTEDNNAELSHILEQLQQKTGFTLTAGNFQEIENRALARSQFRMWVQLNASVPIQGMSIRLWNDLNTQKLIQLESQVENPSTLNQHLVQHGSQKGVADLLRSLSAVETQSLVRSVTASHSDPRVMTVQWKDVWIRGQLTRRVTAKARRGTHTITLSLTSKKVLEAQYREFPQNDLLLPTLVYPMYEEVEGTGKLLARVPTVLRNLLPRVRRASSDPFAPLRFQKYFEDKLNPILGETEAGRAEGYWAMSYIKKQAKELRDALPLSENSFENGGVTLEGRFVTVNLHPAVLQKFPGLNFTPQFSTQFKPDWKASSRDGKELWEMIPSGSLLGKPLLTAEEALNRPARRLADHDPTAYINDGFDEIQVYHAVDTLFRSLHSMGFRDPELATRPFHAFLYDPDIEMRDNAYYTDDTINFTTYSPEAINYARDNSTIWHELGHGVMDRLMGDSIHLADTGGLSEGMADFIAALVTEDVTNGEPFEGSENFRILNHTGFHLTNEVHDDGEAYGGAMHDLMKQAIAKEGRAGLKKVADLTLEAMRLCRNHPALTANDWFAHMLFADELGAAEVRAPGELNSLILAALNGRNFNLDGKPTAIFSLRHRKQEVSAEAPGSRNAPVPVTLSANETATFPLKIRLKNSATYNFQFPVQIRAYLRTGPLQGAVRWKNEDTQPLTYTLHSEKEVVTIPVTAEGVCDFVNREDGSCSDYVYVQVWNDGETARPQAKKRFYVRMTPKQTVKGTPH